MSNIFNSNCICLPNTCHAEPVGTVFLHVFLVRKFAIFLVISRLNAPEVAVLRSPNGFNQNRSEIVGSNKKHSNFFKNSKFFPKNVSWHMKFRVLPVSLFKIHTSIICNLWNRGNNVQYSQQRLHLFTQYVSCRAGRYCIFMCLLVRKFAIFSNFTPKCP